jgi:hypothetical protein
VRFAGLLVAALPVAARAHFSFGGAAPAGWFLIATAV